MSVMNKAFKGASWLALFKMLSQMFSWTTTILVARILTPADYGLMELVTIFTGYAEMFSELGLGSAIIQKEDPTQEELSTIFWFAMGISLFFVVLCFPISYATSRIFNQPKVIPLIQSISVIFLINWLQIIPLNLLKKNLEFKRLGFIEMLAVICSCSSMLIVAYLGGGVWTLLTGYVVLSLVRVILLWCVAKWFPKFSFDFKSGKIFLKFGSIVAISKSFLYVFQKSDKFFAGRSFTTVALGIYSFAINLAQLPTEKITVLINQVSYPALSKLQNDAEEFNRFYLKVVKITATLVLPLFAGCFITSEELVKVLLGDKWVPMIFIFKFLCLAQILTSLTAVNSFVHQAHGRPHWGMTFYGACAVLMSISFYFATQYGMNAMLVPWFTTYIILCLIWICITINKIGVGISLYIRNIIHPLIATVTMVLAIVISMHFIFSVLFGSLNLTLLLILKISTGSLVYTIFLWIFDKELLFDIRSLVRKSS